MRKTLIVMVAGLALAATAAVPAGASVLGASTAQSGGGYGTMAHGGGGRGDGVAAVAGTKPRAAAVITAPTGITAEGTATAVTAGTGTATIATTTVTTITTYGPYDPYYRPYDPYYGDCPAGGYYDSNGNYWYWDPATGTYDACPDS